MQTDRCGTIDCGLRIADCGLRIADCGLRKIRNPQFTIRNRKVPRSACKPGSVPPLTPTLSPEGRGRVEDGDDHFSSPPVARRIVQPTRESWRAGPALLPYLALLPVGFAEPAGHPAAGALLPRSPRAKTRTFSPLPDPGSRRAIGGMLSVALSLSSAGPKAALDGGRYPPPRSAGA